MRDQQQSAARMGSCLVLLSAAVLASCDAPVMIQPDVRPVVISTERYARPMPLVFVDGRQVDWPTVREGLRAELIDRIEVIKGATALAQYGPEAQHGVVLIHTKAAKLK